MNNLLTPVLENAMALMLLGRPPRRLHVSGDDRAARGFKPCFLFVRRAKTHHIMLEGLIWQTHRQPAAGAAAISLILPTASWQIG